MLRCLISRPAYNYLIRKAIDGKYVNGDNIRPLGLGACLSDLGEMVGAYNNVEDVFYDNRHDEEKELDNYRMGIWRTPIWTMGYVRRARSLKITDDGTYGFFRTAVAMKMTMPNPFSGPNINNIDAVVGVVLEAIGVEMLGVKKWPFYSISQEIRKKAIRVSK